MHNHLLDHQAMHEFGLHPGKRPESVDDQALDGRRVFLSCVIAVKIYVVLPHNLRVFIDGKAWKIRYTRLSNQNQAIWSA